MSTSGGRVGKPRIVDIAPDTAQLEADRVRERFERLLGAGVVIFSRHRLDLVLQEIADAARDVVGARYAALGVLHPDGASLAEFVTSGLSEEERRRIGHAPRGQGLLGLVIREARPVRVPDITAHPKSYGFPSGHPPMTSFLGVPVTAGRRIFGQLYLTDKIGAPGFSDEDEAIAVMMAAQAAVAVENARLFEESERLLAQVRAMQRQRDLFFAMMNHELRNALTGVYGWAERLVRGKGKDAVQAAAEVYEGAERTITLLNNLLDLSRLDAGKIRPVWREVDLATEVRRATVGLQPIAEAKHLTLAPRCPGDLGPFRTDPVRLQQILVNLLSNAIRHSPEGATVHLEATPRPGEMEFRVRDSGAGVPVEIRDRIFEPFERHDPHSGQGAGLGLAVSRRLAEMLGGRLEVEETSEPGATFLLVLPVEAGSGA